RSAAYIAVIIYISSIYFNIISGLFILPDSPQNFFVLFSLSFLLPSITVKEPSAQDLRNIIFFGLFTGLAFLSKYQSLFLWFGAGLYILFHNRIWLKKPTLYLSVLVTLILMIPVIYWNYKNHFISFTYHGSRIGLSGGPVNLVYFLQFNAGQFFYQNPVLSVIYIITLFKIFMRERQNITGLNLALLYLGIPLIVVFTFLSLFRNTLPHWSGPAFICLIILSSNYLSEAYVKRRNSTVGILTAAALTFIFVLILGTIQIKTGIIGLQKDPDPAYPGKNDFTLDMFGWKQAKEKFSGFLRKEGIPENEHSRLAIVTDNWFQAAHLDYYVAYPLNIKLLALGRIERIHKYFWIDKERIIRKSDRVFYITDSRNYHDPVKFSSCFSGIVPKDTLIISRNKKPVKYIFIYDLAGLKCDSILYSPDPGF
ncbi:MAG: glycosyltransferase family 39 protein, partial [Bacteroidota bacterium]|nr:glycosyltransferase family 39 protein [Bacteroidota bacterium]